MLHFAVPLSAGIGALFQLSFDFSIYRQVFLIADGMLKACPEVHSDCTELYLHRHMDLFFRKEYRQPDRQVQTAIAIWFRVWNIIFLCDNFNVRLIFKHFAKINSFISIAYTSFACAFQWLGRWTLLYWFFLSGSCLQLSTFLSWRIASLPSPCSLLAHSSANGCCREYAFWQEWE